MSVISEICRKPDEQALDEAAAILTAGGLVIVPTDTVYGMAADPRSANGLERLVHAKGRPDGKPIARLAASIESVRASGAVLCEGAERLAQAFWPGPLTLVLPCGDNSVGFRVPDHSVTRSLIERAGVPLAVSSANLSGHPDALSLDDVPEALMQKVDLALDAGRSPGGVPSSVVRVTESGVEVLREGALTRKELLAIWNTQHD